MLGSKKEMTVNFDEGLNNQPERKESSKTNPLINLIKFTNQIKLFN